MVKYVGKKVEKQTAVKEAVARQKVYMGLVQEERRLRRSAEWLADSLEDVYRRGVS